MDVGQKDITKCLHSLCLDGRLWVIYRLRELLDENEVDAWAVDAWIFLFWGSLFDISIDTWSAVCYKLLYTISMVKCDMCEYNVAQTRQDPFMALLHRKW